MTPPRDLLRRAALLVAAVAAAWPGAARDGDGLRRRIAARVAGRGDWAQRARYRAENARLGPPLPGEARVVFLGDSITDLWGREAGSFFPGRPYLNRGISGQTTPQMLLRMPEDVIALQPRAVVILAGTNDLAGNTGPMRLSEIEATLEAMLDLAEVHHLRVVLASLLPVHDHATLQSAARAPSRILELNAWIRRAAARHGAVYLDYHAAMVDAGGALRSELSDDGLHPNAAGYAVMAPLAQRAIEQALR